MILGRTVKELAGGGGIANGGLLVDAEHSGEVQGIGPVGECFVELAVDAETLQGGDESSHGIRHP